jgi:hypothetical protein
VEKNQLEKVPATRVQKVHRSVPRRAKQVPNELRKVFVSYLLDVFDDVLIIFLNG